MRHCIAKVAIDVWSAVMRLLMENMLLGPLSVQDAGVVLELQNTRGPIFFKLHGFVGDTLALDQIWGTFGCGIHIPCFTCWNMCHRNSKIADQSDRLVDTACSNNVSCGVPSPVQRSTDLEIWSKYDTLVTRVAGERRKTYREAHERSAGIHVRPNGLLASLTLRNYIQPATSHQHDPMHMLVSNRCPMDA